jgi:hypothetical protein
MSLPIPNLDDRTFDDLMKEARSLIPRYNNEWTNHNPQDPGITLLELFAWLTEMIIYRTNQIPEENYWAFLKLSGVEMETEGKGTISSHGLEVTGDGTDFTAELKKDDYITSGGQRKSVTTVNSGTSLTIDSAFDPELPAGTGFTCSSESVESGIRKGLESISRQYRAITKEDYESLSLECMDILNKGLAGRAICVNNRDLEFSSDNTQNPGHVTVIIIPRCNENPSYCKDGLPTDDLRSKVKEYLDARKLITTRVHVVAPDYLSVKLEVNVALRENTVEETVKQNVKDSIVRYFSPLDGGKDKKGWPLGRSIYRSEIYQLVEGMSDVDHVVAIRIDDSDADFKKIQEYQLISITVEVP